MKEPRSSAADNVHRPPRPPTIYDVAARAGVSITTVSNTLNRPARVGAATRARVLTAVDELGFTPKAAAVSLARKGVGRIAALAPFSSYASYRVRLMGVLAACQEKSVEVAVFDHESAAESTSPLLSALPATGRLDGLLLMGIPLRDAMAARLVKRALPTVLIDTAHRDLTSVTVDDEHSGYLVGQYLLSRGHRTLAYVSEAQQSADFLSQGQKRLRGLQKALADGGLPATAMRQFITTSDLDGGERAAAAILAGDWRPDAAIAHFDDIAAGLLVGFRNAGLRVPDDIAVVGHDDGDLAQALGLTTVRQPLSESGRLACSLLLDALHGAPTQVQHVLLPTEIIVRDSA